jgi:hypothetical protein
MPVGSLPSYFPRSKGCDIQAQGFFDCFSKATEQYLNNTSEQATGTSNTGGVASKSDTLEGCKSQFKLYDRCMQSALKKHPQKYSRAGAAYRGRA